MYNAKAYSACSPKSPLASTTIKRRDPNEHDVQIEILYCGICHSDLHQVRNEWSEFMPTVYPCVVGPEILGRVTKVGSAVSKFKPGDLAAVGCMVDSEGTCPECKAGLEQFCPNGILRYNFPDKHLGGVTYGGYSESVVVDQRFVLHVPSNLDPAGAAPLRLKTRFALEPMRSSTRAIRTRCRSTPAASTLLSTVSQPIETFTRTSICCAGTARSRWLAALETPRRSGLRVDRGTTQPVRVPYRRNRRDPGNARFLRRA